MRVFKDYKDFLENKSENENGVSEEFLNDYYGGDIKKAEDDNISNKGCFDCVKCVMCKNCVRCGYLAHSIQCFEASFSHHMEFVDNRIQSDAGSAHVHIETNNESTSVPQ